MDRHNQTLPDHWFEKVFESPTQLGIPVSIVKILALTSARWVCEALFYIRISSKSSQKQNSHSHGNVKQSAIFGVTEMTRYAAPVAPHQLKNGTASIMT